MTAALSCCPGGHRRAVSVPADRAGAQAGRQLVPATLVQCLSEPAARWAVGAVQTLSTTGLPPGTRASQIKEAPATLTFAASKV